MPNLNFQPGDYVKLRLAKKELEGRVLENLDSLIILLKLDSGYNMGIAKENILGGRAIKKFKAEGKSVPPNSRLRSLSSSRPAARKIVEHDTPACLGSEKGLPTIGLIVTGGTIASKLDPRTGGVAPLTDVGEFAKFYPEMFKIANVKIESPFMEMSECMTSEHWKKIASVCEEMLNDKEISGVVITHGTDTLHYTAAALSFFLKNLNKPVVLTYSQRSIDRASSDANLNLQCAARFALSDCAEVVLVGHSSTNDDFCYVMRGTKVRKLHSSTRDAFKTVNASPIAKVWAYSPKLRGKMLPSATPHSPSWAGEKENLLANFSGQEGEYVKFLSGYRPRNEDKVELDTEFSDKVALVKFYPGQDPGILDYYALKYKGLIIEGTGLGHVSCEWLAKLRKHIREGMVVCMTSQCIFGRVDKYVYSTGRELLDAGVIFLEDMLAETALVKLSWVLGHYGWKTKVKEKMLENVAGEFNEKLTLLEPSQ